MEWLAIWGVAQTAAFLFKPILENLAIEVAKGIGESYVGECFKRVFSPLHRKPLARATGRAVKELLELIEDELRDAELDESQLKSFIPDIEQFIQHQEVSQIIGTSFLETDSTRVFDTAVFAGVWEKLEGVHRLPDEFGWQRISKRFARKVAEIRASTAELRETFDSLSTAVADALIELKGLPPDFDLDTYRDALIERFGNLSFESLDTTGAYYSAVRLWSVFVPQSVRETHDYNPRLLEIPKEQQQRLMDAGELEATAFGLDEKQLEEQRREYFDRPDRPVLDVTGDASLPHTVILGDPGSGKSSLLRYLALQWARIEDVNQRYTQLLPLLIELRDYHRWECHSHKSFLRYLHEAPTLAQFESTDAGPPAETTGPSRAASGRTGRGLRPGTAPGCGQ